MTGASSGKPRQGWLVEYFPRALGCRGGPWLPAARPWGDLGQRTWLVYELDKMVVEGYGLGIGWFVYERCAPG